MIKAANTLDALTEENRMLRTDDAAVRAEAAEARHDGQQLAIGMLTRRAEAAEADAATAWDKCEQRRLEAVRAINALIEIKEDLLCNDPRKLGPILRKIDAVIGETT